MEEKKNRSLRLIAILAVGISFISFLIIFFLIFQSSISEMLFRTEARHVAEQRDVVLGTLESSIHTMEIMAADVAGWEETVRFVEGENPDFIANNWPGASILEGYSFNAVLIKNRAGDDVYVDAYDPIDMRIVPMPPGLSEALGPVADMIIDKYTSMAGADGPAADYAMQGVLFVEEVPYYICGMPVALLGEQEAPSGTLFLADILSEEYVKSNTFYPDTDFQLMEIADQNTESSIERISEDRITISVPMNNLYGGKVALVIGMDRQVYQEGKAVMARTTLMLVAAVALFMLAIYFIFHRLIFAPLEGLSRDLGNIRQTGSVDMAKYSGGREFTRLASNINGMLERINQSNMSLTVFKSILDGMDAYLYVTDPGNDKILFINEKMLRHYEIKGQVAGRHCWEVLQEGQKGRCGFCPVRRLEENPEGVIIWEEHSKLTGRIYRNTDRLIEWADGHLVHLQHSVDITQAKADEQVMSRRLEQQELMSAMSRSFISIEDTSLLVDNALKMTGNFMDVSRILVGRIDGEEGVLCFINEWVNETQDITPMGEITSPFAPGDPLHDSFMLENATSVSCDDAANDPQYAYLTDVGVKAFIDVPIYVSNELWGLLCIDECTRTHQWTESDIQLLNLIGSIIGGATTRSHMEENLLRMSSIVDSAPLFISYVDQAGNFQYFNRGVSDISGYTAEELWDEGMDLIFTPGRMEEIRHTNIPLVLEQGHMEHELPLTRKDGEVRILEFSVFTAGKENPGIGAIATDVTEKRKLERDLVAAKEQAEQSNRAKGDFLSRMSHEMRTPMNAIIGMTSIAKASNDVERLEYCLGRIDEASKHLLGVINDILDMSKIESGKLEISTAEFEFERMLMRAVNVVNFRLDEKHQTLNVLVDKNVPRFLIGDEQRLNQVITNLFSNAVKFTPEQGSITLRASVDGEENGVVTLRIDVTDTGIGISPEQQRKLFRSFEQADGGISRKFGGTGLGLAISKSIVELMGGTIWIDSELGKGATFTFTVQCRRSEGQETQLLPQTINWSNVRIMAVDDSSDVREYFLTFAESMGIDCSVAADGKEAIDLISSNQGPMYNIIFVDWKMPGMNGVELTREIRPRLAHNTVVIMISAAEWSDIEAEAKDVGIDRFIPKPLFSSKLADCITECLGAGESHPPVSEGEDFTGRFLGKRLLLAEDIEINREIVIALLQDTGVVIDCAEDGRKAFEMFRDDPSYDLIFMDIHMPEIDGYEATRRIRALDEPRAKTVPIVAMTANVFREDIERCLAAGMNDHVGKPIDMEEILAKLVRYLP